jgi:hypothetical protein
MQRTRQTPSTRPLWREWKKDDGATRRTGRNGLSQLGFVALKKSIPVCRENINERHAARRLTSQRFGSSTLKGKPLFTYYFAPMPVGLVATTPSSRHPSTTTIPDVFWRSLINTGNLVIRSMLFTNFKLLCALLGKKCLALNATCWNQQADATGEDRQRPRVLVLRFEQVAGLNLQSYCHNVFVHSVVY